MSALLVIGAGGNGRVIADVAERTGEWSRIAFLDDALPAGSEVEHWKVLGPCSHVREIAPDHDAVVIGFGDNGLRHEWIERMTATGHDLASIVADSASVSGRASIGPGCVVMPNAVVNIGARLGPGCIVNTGATVDHDCRLGAAVHISPGAHLGGEVAVGDRTWIGVGASVRHGATIDSDVMVGAGAAVVSDLPPNCIAVGVPARIRG